MKKTVYFFLFGLVILFASKAFASEVFTEVPCNGPYRGICVDIDYDPPAIAVWMPGVRIITISAPNDREFYNLKEKGSKNFVQLNFGIVTPIHETIIVDLPEANKISMTICSNSWPQVFLVIIFVHLDASGAIQMDWQHWAGASVFGYAFYEAADLTGDFTDNETSTTTTIEITTTSTVEPTTTTVEPTTTTTIETSTTSSIIVTTTIPTTTSTIVVTTTIPTTSTTSVEPTTTTIVVITTTTVEPTTTTVEPTTTTVEPTTTTTIAYFGDCVVQFRGLAYDYLDGTGLYVVQLAPTLIGTNWFLRRDISPGVYVDYPADSSRTVWIDHWPNGQPFNAKIFYFLDPNWNQLSGPGIECSAWWDGDNDTEAGIEFPLGTLPTTTTTVVITTTVPTTTTSMDTSTSTTIIITTTTSINTSTTTVPTTTTSMDTSTTTSIDTSTTTSILVTTTTTSIVVTTTTTVAPTTTTTTPPTTTIPNPFLNVVELARDNSTYTRSVTLRAGYLMHGQLPIDSTPENNGWGDIDTYLAANPGNPWMSVVENPDGSHTYTYIATIGQAFRFSVYQEGTDPDRVWVNPFTDINDPLFLYRIMWGPLPQDWHYWIPDPFPTP